MMQKHRAVTLERFEKFVSPIYFADINLRSKLVERVLPDSVLELGVQHVQGRPLFADVDKSDAAFQPCAVGDSFGPSWSTHWFVVKVQLPAEFTDVSGLMLEWDCSAEALVYDAAGTPIQGLTGGDGDDRRVEVPLELLLAHSTTVYIEMSCNGLFGVGNAGMINPPDPNRTFRLASARILAPHAQGRKLWRYFELLSGMAASLPPDSVAAARALTSANDIVNAYRRDDASIDRCIELAEHAVQALSNSSPLNSAFIVGHCHIDTAWLWPYAETRRKCARSWASQIALMDRYPEYKFACSQMQQFEWVRQDYPALFARIQEKVAAGQFIPIGGTWVEMDCNIPDGESLVRQFLYGQGYMQEMFGTRSRIFWLPDTFGYASQLPQLMKQAGMDYFLTQKLSWNLINKFPHTTFLWQGLDGSDVLVHFPPGNTYNGRATVEELCDITKNHRDKERCADALHLVGFGDGGGGPTADHIERVRLSSSLQGLAVARFADPVEAFDTFAKSRDRLLTWSGELYLELHRGTYTSQALTKLRNRKLQVRLRFAEALSVAALLSAQLPYPADALRDAYKSLLLNQFHDVIPGTSIASVYEDVMRLYDDAGYAAASVMQDATKALSSKDTSLAALNMLGTRRDASVILVPEEAAAGSTGTTQAFEGGVLVYLDTLPPYSAVPVSARTSPSEPVSASTASDGQVVLENAYLRATINASGELSSLIDKLDGGREVLKSPGNELRMYSDVPLFWDAWDVEVYHSESHRSPLRECLPTIELLSSGPLRACVRVSGKLSDHSTWEQEISLECDARQVAFSSSVDWHDNRTMLKTHFPVDIIGATDAVYETQWGLVKRPTHANTSWDMAKFEVCAQRFAALSEDNFGVVLFNDSKHGYSCRGADMGLSLLRSPKAPDDTCDMGRHTFRYALGTFSGTLAQGRVVQRAADFNAPLIDFAAIRTAAPWVRAHGVHQSEYVLVETLKQSEDSSAVIVRAYEAYGGRDSVSFEFAWSLKSLVLCNILEDAGDAIAFEGNRSAPISFKPFQIVSLRATFV